MSLFDEDCAITAAVEALGMELIRQQPITIYDRPALEAAGLMRKSPDYRRIRELLNKGIAVPGASLGPVEYVVRHPGVTEQQLEAADAAERSGKS